MFAKSTDSDYRSCLSFSVIPPFLWLFRLVDFLHSPFFSFFFFFFSKLGLLMRCNLLISDCFSTLEAFF